MKKCFLHILLVGVLGMLAVSCSDEYDSMGLDSRQAQVVFSVAMDTPVSRSRTAEDNTWGSQYNPSSPGDAYDNRIDINQFIVKIVDDEKEYKIKDIIKWKTEGAENVYKFVGVVEGIDQSTELTNPKVYVYANMGKDQPADTFSQDAANIPMWGVKSIQGNKTFAPGTRVDLEEISLLRAMAKLEVSLNDEMFKEFALTGATLNKHNPTGYTLPMLPNGFDDSTEDLSLEGVFNPMTGDSQGTLALAVAVKDSSYVVYLPEVKNEELKITVQLKQKKVDASGNVTYGSEEEGTFSLSSDVVRNHWYKYNITGFAASQIQVNYETVPWTNVNIQLGGDGFLFLNKDVIEIYNSNIDADQLTFASSSPIASIELKDIYTQNYDGTFTEGVEDGVSAYYISKFGQKIQLGKDPGFEISDKGATLANEAVILSNIKATAEAETLNGGITITSPFLADPDNEISALQQNSHYDTPRYLEFLVTNTQGLTATFRVIQYPPVVIVNEEGYFSYRDDFCEGYQELGTNKPAVNWLNYQEKAYVLAFLQNTEIHQVDPLLVDKFGNDYAAISTDPGAECTFKELLLADGGNGGWYKSSVYPYGEFQRLFYENMGKQSQNQLVGVPYYDPDYVHPAPSTIDPVRLQDVINGGRDNWWRKHYTGNMIEFFMSKVIKQVYRDGIDNNGYKDDKGNIIKRLPGQADIFHHMPDGKGGWRLTTAVVNVNTMQFNNNRMYHIKTQQVTDKFTIGYPQFVAGDSVLVENKKNANLVSPSFMVASQLGTTEMPVNDHPGIYEDASPQLIYEMAKIHCKQYVETTFEDTNGNGKPEPELGEKVTYYRNWRLPTKAEIDLIIEYQNSSRAMDVLLTGQRYACVTGVEGQYFSDDVKGFVNPGYFMRCVRDVKPNENK